MMFKTLMADGIYHESTDSGDSDWWSVVSGLRFVFASHSLANNDLLSW